MADFLLELRSEEIPARMQAKARNDLARLFAEAADEAGLKTGAIEAFSTPRRLALIAREVADATEASREELKGPRTSAPAQALEGFLRKTGLTQDQLEERDGVYFAVIERPGANATEILEDVIRGVVADFPWPKSMRWGSGSMRWVRPLHGIIALLGEDVVPVEVEGVASGATTVGHRFHHPGAITIGGASDYLEKLRACHVIVDQDERERIIREGAQAAAKKAGLAILPDEGLVIENAGLTEWPVPLAGSFDPDFLDVPREVIVLTMRTNQKYFACTNDQGLLAPGFVCVANIDANDGGKAIAEGNARVLAARLSDARFFWEQDLKISLEERLPSLENMLFAEGLGTLRSKADRIAELAAFIGKNFLQIDPLIAGRGGELAKADLASGMVGEFPELQGIMGGYYAERAGENERVASAIRQQYAAEVEGDAAISVYLADRIDTLAAFFSKGIKPTGSKDPFALRRAAIQSIQAIVDNNVRIPLLAVFNRADAGLPYTSDNSGWDGRLNAGELLDFIADRLKVQQRDAGVRHDLIDAVFSLGGEDDLVRLLARVNALQQFVETQEGADLLAAYKRAANILKKENWTGPQVMSSKEEQGIPQTGEEDPLVLVDDPIVGEAIAEMASGQAGADLPEEKALITALDAAEPKAAAAVEVEDFTGAMAALATLRVPIDAFFDKVTVNDADAAKRERRLNLLTRFRDAVNRVADFSKIEG